MHKSLCWQLARRNCRRGQAKSSRLRRNMSALRHGMGTGDASACAIFFSFKKHPILNKNCRVRLQLEKSAKQKALRSRKLELATPRHLCTSLWETGNAQLGTELCLYFAALWESKEMAIRKSRKASRSPASQQTFSICKSMIERVCHTLEKDGLCRGKLVRELHCWE